MQIINLLSLWKFSGTIQGKGTAAVPLHEMVLATSILQVQPPNYYSTLLLLLWWSHGDQVYRYTWVNTHPVNMDTYLFIYLNALFGDIRGTLKGQRSTEIMGYYC